GLDGGGADAATQDAAMQDAAAQDAVVPDAARVDSGLPDAAPVDAAPPDAAVPGPECSDPGSTCRLDADCPSQVCSALLPAGPCQCVEAAPPPAVVPGGAGCLDDAACPGAHCQAEGTDAQNQRCGGPEPVANLCVPDACAKDADCGEGRTCVRAGEYGHVRAACVPATCRADADCVEHPEGRCQPFFTPCFVRGFSCTYAIDTCRVDADCPQRGSPRVCLPLPGGVGTECVVVE
ncbi:MAG: hypothetical protein R3F60_34130, partial [bacterium]